MGDEYLMMPTTTSSRHRSFPTLVLACAVPVIAVLALVVTRVVEGPSAARASTAGASATAVVIRNFSFSPKTLTVVAGTRVEVANRDGTQHTLTAINGSFDTGVLAGGKHASVSPRTPGTFRYHCNIHPDMTGTLVVR